jgi:methyltransferase family protein
MFVRRFLKTLVALPLGFLRQPGLSLRLLRDLPTTLRGFNYSQNWRSEGGGQTLPLSSGNESADSANPLKAFFDARETGRGIWKWAHYFDIYHHHFSKFVGRDAHVLEIGIFSGGSLEMWRHYFGPKSQIYGVDIAEECKVYENEYTSIFIGDQADRSFWKAFKQRVPYLDILIDDGGHTTEQQIVTLEEMLPHLRPGGIFLCEDVVGVYNGFSAYVHGLVSNLNETRAGVLEDGVNASEFQNWIHAVHFYPYVTVIERADKPLQQFTDAKRGTEWQPWLPRSSQ